MAEITRRRRGELVRGVFEILAPEAEGLPAKDFLRQLQGNVPPTAFENSTYPDRPNVRRYDKIVRFSTVAAVKAGWLIKDKGQWSLTDEGVRAVRDIPEPERFMLTADRLYRQWKRDQPDIEESIGGVTDADTGRATTTFEESEEQAWAEIEDYLASMNPFDFQTLVAGLLKGMGYHVSWVSPPGSDRGVDVIAHLDPLGIEGPRIKAQVKRQADRVGVEGIRSFLAILSTRNVGLYVCTGGFTRDAENEARGQENRRVMLVDLRRLFQLWTEHYDKVPEQERRLLPLRPIYYLAPVE